jgi:formate hydrogenlyase subunit 6/NADH:ubiquinone oxidoreductase subunit I
MMFDILIKTLKTGTVTTNYPKEPDIAPPGFRGKPELIPEKCTLCGECVKVCPPDVIWLNKDNEENTLTLSVCGCIFCGRCEEVCPQSAIILIQEYELASKTKDDLLTIIRRKV